MLVAKDGLYLSEERKNSILKELNSIRIDLGLLKTNDLAHITKSIEELNSIVKKLEEFQSKETEKVANKS